MSDTSTEPNSQGGIMTERRRKRVNRLKALIIVLTVLLLILPTVFCIILGIQVSRLQKQMKELVDLHSEYGLTYDNGNEGLAYAAEKDNNTTAGETITALGSSTGSDTQSSADTNADTASTVADNTADVRDSSGAGSDKTDGTETGKLNDTNTVNADGTQTGDISAADAGNAAITDADDTVTTDAGDTAVADANNTAVADAGDTTAADADITAAADANITAADAGNAAGAGIASVTPIDGSVISPTDNSSPNAVVADIYKGKNVYLTFDDGPSIYTGEILDILAEYNVKATFFVIGKTDKASKKLYQRIVDEGHTLGMHSYSHNYDIIYNSVEDFDKDFTKLWKLLYDTTGYKPFLYRFPGGSNNKVNKYGMEEFIRYLNNSSITYFDWNVVNGDATGIQYTKEQLIANVLNGVAEKKNPIVLMHDARSKETTVEALPGLLDQLILGGAQILPLDKDVKPIQMIKADSIK